AEPSAAAAAGAAAGALQAGGTGLKGLTERLAAAGGSLRAGPAPHGGFTVTAEVPTKTVTPPEIAAAATAPRAR
ncbi:sensor histidine kinase, partial [Streptomyces sp. GXMU-J5]|nr:sensor histidine kinase [Streptomyces beihaiensis]